MREFNNSPAGLANYANVVANGLRQQIQDGVSPLQRTWAAGERFLPYNPKTGQTFRGVNALWLSALQTEYYFEDNRWMTERQAANLGGTVAPDAEGAHVVHWQWRETQQVLDERGRPVLDPATGRPQTRVVEFEKPRVWSATVFNAAQISGLDLAAMATPALAEQPLARIDTILNSFGPKLTIGAGLQPGYDVATDTMTMAPLAEFADPVQFYAAALHQVIHSTGHPDRMNRDLTHPVGSMEFAREELVANIAGLFVGDHLQIGADPGFHKAYALSWAIMLEEDPRALFRAATTAGKILENIRGLNYGLQQPQATQAVPPPQVFVEANMPTLPPVAPIQQEPFPLVVPYRDRDEAIARGAVLNGDQTLSVPPGMTLDNFKQWIPNASQTVAPPVETPKEAFLKACKNMGLVMPEAIDDGRLHRVPVQGDKGSERSGAYTLHSDGRPAGYIENFRTNENARWKYEGVLQDTLTRGTSAAKQSAQQKQRAEQQNYIYKVAAQAAEAAWELCDPAPADHKYLQKKGVGAHGIRVITPEAAKVINAYTEKVCEALHEPFKPLRIVGNLAIPVHNDGKITSLQNISGTGFKGFMKAAQMGGGSFQIGEVTPGQPAVIAEGYATAATIHEKTGLPVAVAFIADNMKAVAQAYRGKYRDQVLLIAGDNDHQKPFEKDPNGRPKINKGKVRSQAAALAVGGYTMLPNFERDNPRTDWNDIWMSNSPEASRQWNEGVDRALMLATGVGLENKIQAAELAQAQQAEIAQPLDIGLSL